MLQDAGEGRAAAPTLERLRSATRAAHEALETRLALLDPPLERARFVAALQMFEAFHRAWDPRVAALAPATIASRIGLARQDLAALGAAPDPAIGVDLGFLTDAATAWGSRYVVEGSALGGQLISKRLRDADWLPEGGLTYFNPYGRETGARWRTFCAALEDAAAGLDGDRVAQGARDTFSTLCEAAPARPVIAA